MKNKHLLLPESHCRYCLELAEDCGCSRGKDVLNSQELSDIHKKIDWKVKNNRESDTYEAEFIPAILHAQSKMTAHVVFNELKNICDLPVGHSLRYVPPSGFEHNPDCRVCKLDKFKEKYAL